MGADRPVRLSGKLRDYLKNWDTMGCRVSHMVLQGLTTNEEIDYLSIRQDGTISYLPNGRLHIAEHGVWKKDGRQTGKPASTIRRAMQDGAILELRDVDFERFANLVRGLKSGFNEVVLVNGPDIYYWYLAKHSNGEELCSCMDGEENQDQLDLYAQNPREISLAVLLNAERKSLGRALVWVGHDGKKFMDKAYGIDDYHRLRLRGYGLSKGWDVRQTKTPSGLFCYEWSVKDICVPLSHPLPKTRYPYLDTMSGVYDQSNTIHSGKWSVSLGGSFEERAGPPPVRISWGEEEGQEPDEHHVANQPIVVADQPVATYVHFEQG